MDERRAGRRINDYAAIGDGRSLALVSKTGAIEWLCWPQFDSPSIFARLLTERGGSWTISPVAPTHASRRYLEDTNVLETCFESRDGRVVLTDFMPVTGEDEKRRQLWPENALFRHVRCDRGAMELSFVFDPRPGYAREKVRVREHGDYALRVETARGLLTMQGTEPICRRRSGGGLAASEGCFTLRAGESASFLLTFSTEAPAVLPPPAEWAPSAFDDTVRWWKTWARQARYDGPFRAEVVRSALALKLLFFAPSGAVVAAPTTSLPEKMGGDWNWDYRFAWLRDSALTMRALLALGYTEEAHAFIDWLLHTTRLTRPELRVLYDVYGRTPDDERILHEWEGFRCSRPVRIRNAAATQVQLDVYGEVIDAVTLSMRSGASLDRQTRALLRDFGRFVSKNWRAPDHGIWEPRTPPQHYTHSKVLCWVALQRLTELCECGAFTELTIEELAAERDRVGEAVRAHAWNPERGAYVDRFGGTGLDSSVLLLSWYGFEPATSARMRSTGAAIRAALSPRQGLLYRNEYGRDQREGAFGICAFWYAEFLARGGGSLAHARAFFREAAAQANDVGLLAEEVDPQNGEALGNFPQAFTHVGLIGAALALEERAADEGIRSTPEHEEQTSWEDETWTSPVG